MPVVACTSSGYQQWRTRTPCPAPSLTSLPGVLYSHASTSALHARSFPAANQGNSTQEVPSPQMQQRISEGRGGCPAERETMARRCMSACIVAGATSNIAADPCAHPVIERLQHVTIVSVRNSKGEDAGNLQPRHWRRRLLRGGALATTTSCANIVGPPSPPP